MPYQYPFNTLQPTQFQPTYTQVIPTSVPGLPYQPPFNGITKVNGPESALQRQLPPNSTSEPMFDANGTMFYVVSTDGTGSKSIEKFDFSPHVDVQQQAPPSSDYVTREEFQAFVERMTHGTDGPVQTTTEQTL